MSLLSSLKELVQLSTYNKSTGCEFVAYPCGDILDPRYLIDVYDVSRFVLESYKKIGTKSYYPLEIWPIDNYIAKLSKLIQKKEQMDETSSLS